MADILCAKCKEPWDSYGVHNGDMNALEAERFLRGEGCPSCGFGTWCVECEGIGFKPTPNCSVCMGFSGKVFPWRPANDTRLYKAGQWYYGYAPNVRPVPDGIRVQVKGSHMTAEGRCFEGYVPCWQCYADGQTCVACNGTGEWQELPQAEKNKRLFEAAASAMEASDDDPVVTLMDYVDTAAREEHRKRLNDESKKHGARIGPKWADIKEQAIAEDELRRNEEERNQ